MGLPGIDAVEATRGRKKATFRWVTATSAGPLAAHVIDLEFEDVVGVPPGSQRLKPPPQLAG